jgi:hypothetical protein
MEMEPDENPISADCSGKVRNLLQWGCGIDRLRACYPHPVNEWKSIEKSCLLGGSADGGLPE